MVKKVKNKHREAIFYARRSLWEGFKTKDVRRKLIELFGLTTSQSNDVIRLSRKKDNIYYPKYR